MKVQYILPFFGMLAIVSCKQNESIFNEDNNKAIFSGSIHQMQTRVSGTSWDANDTIGICMVAAGTNTVSGGIDNYAYVTTGDGYFSPSTEEQTIYYPLDKSAVDFVAYYPYRQRVASVYGVSNWNSARQDTLDLLVAKVSNKSQKDPEAELSFYHQFSKLVLNIATNSETGLTDADLAGMKVSIAGINKPADYNLLSQTVEYGESLTENVAMQVSANGKTASAIVPSATGSSIIFTLADGSTYTWDISAQSFESGKLYPYAITLKATPNYVEASLGSLINDWNSGDGVYINLDQDTIVDNSGRLFGHDYVDLGLPSGTMWATCNVGAENPEDFGGYYAFGEVETKETYDWSTYKYCNGSEDGLTKYCLSTEDGNVDNRIALMPSDDVASVVWGANWRMPSRTDAKELLSECTWVSTQQNGVNGYLVTGPNGNNIFIPQSGWYNGSSLDQNTLIYLTSTLSMDTRMARRLSPFFLMFHNDFIAVDWRRAGFPIRPVYLPNEVKAASISLDQSSLSLMVGGSTSTLFASVLPANTSYSEVFWVSSNDSVANVDNGVVTPKGEGSCYISAITEDGTNLVASCYVQVTPSTPNFNGHDYVDLGLSSGLLWATCNVGASSPGEYGKYYAWGETKAYGEEDTGNSMNYKNASTYIKTEYSWTTYKYCNGTYNSLTKYSASTNYGIVDNKTILESTDDAATANWRGSWRTPTDAEIAELVQECYWEWTTDYLNKGITGYIVFKVKSDADKGLFSYNTPTLSSTYSTSDTHIFLPAAGSKTITSSGPCGCYWSASLLPDFMAGARRIGFCYNEVSSKSYQNRFVDLTIRPVCSPSKN